MKNGKIQMTTFGEDLLPQTCCLMIIDANGEETPENLTPIRLQMERLVF